jgi:hypothetical protein
MFQIYPLRRASTGVYKVPRFATDLLEYPICKHPRSISNIIVGVIYNAENC